MFEVRLLLQKAANLHNTDLPTETEKKERKEKHTTEKMISQTETQLDRAQEAEESRILAERNRDAAGGSEQIDWVDHDKPKRKRLSLGLLRKEKQPESTEQSPQSPHKLKSLVHRFKRRSGAPNTNSSQGSSSIADLEAMGGTYHEKEPETEEDDRKDGQDAVEDDNFEDAEETLPTPSNKLPSNDKPSQHRMSFNNGSDSSVHKGARATRFHEVGLE